MPYEFKMTRRVEFADTDMAGMLHFTNFFRYMEEAEHAFYRSLGFSVHVPMCQGSIGWPRVHAACDYVKPLRFEDEVEIHLLVRCKKMRSIAYMCVFRKIAKTGSPEIEPVARGSMTVVCTTMANDREGLKTISIPSGISDKIEESPTDVLDRSVAAQSHSREDDRS